MSITEARWVKNLPAMQEMQGDGSLSPRSGRSSAGGQGNPLQYSRLENPIDREAWRTAFQSMGCKESDAMEHARSPQGCHPVPSTPR